MSDSCQEEQPGVLGTVSARYYRFLRERAPFDTTPSHVKIVTIDTSVEGGWVANPCDSRIFTGKLLLTVADQRPAAIVIDWSNAPDSCRDEEINSEYQHSVIAASLGAPVVFARSTTPMESLRRKDPARFERLPADGRAGDHFLLEADLFDSVEGGRVSFGLSRLNCDVRKIPLKWWTYPERAETSGSARATLAPTLPLQAVIDANYAEVLTGSRISALIAGNRHPFSQLDAEFEDTHAIDLICEQRRNDLTPDGTCAAGMQSRARLSRVRGKIVLIADTSGEEDNHESPIGKVPGAVLQANYIEGLISGRFWKPANIWFQLIVSLCWFAVVEVVFATHAQRPLAAVGYAVGITVVFSIFLYYLLVILLGYYFVLLPPSLLLIFIRTILLVTHPPHPQPDPSTGHEGIPTGPTAVEEGP